MNDEDGLVERFGQRIRRLREGKGWSQDRLAAETGIHRTYISGVERGARNPSLRNIIRLAAALDVSLASLFTDDGS